MQSLQLAFLSAASQSHPSLSSVMYLRDNLERSMFWQSLKMFLRWQLVRGCAKNACPNLVVRKSVKSEKNGTPARSIFSNFGGLVAMELTVARTWSTVCPQRHPPSGIASSPPVKHILSTGSCSISVLKSLTDRIRGTALRMQALPSASLRLTQAWTTDLATVLIPPFLKGRVFLRMAQLLNLMRFLNLRSCIALRRYYREYLWGQPYILTPSDTPQLNSHFLNGISACAPCCLVVPAVWKPCRFNWQPFFGGLHFACPLKQKLLEISAISPDIDDLSVLNIINGGSISSFIYFVSFWRCISSCLVNPRKLLRDHKHCAPSNYNQKLSKYIGNSFDQETSQILSGSPWIF